MPNESKNFSMLIRPGIAGFILPSFFLLLINGPAMATCSCKEQPQEPVGECSVNIELCGCLKKVDWSYAATAEDNASGKAGDSSGHETVEEAVNEAISNMFLENPELASKCFPA